MNKYYVLIFCSRFYQKKSIHSDSETQLAAMIACSVIYEILGFPRENFLLSFFGFINVVVEFDLWSLKLRARCEVEARESRLFHSNSLTDRYSGSSASSRLLHFANLLFSAPEDLVRRLLSNAF